MMYSDDALYEEGTGVGTGLCARGANVGAVVVVAVVYGVLSRRAYRPCTIEYTRVGG